MKNFTRKIKNYIKKNPSSPFSKLTSSTYALFNDFILVLANLTGYFPSHTIRNVLYRRIFRIKMPSDSTIYCRCRFLKPTDVNIGHNSIIGEDAFLDGRYGIYIGDNVNIGGDLRIYTMELDIESEDFGSTGSSIFIEDRVYIGTRVIILPGVKIKEGAVVASGAVVTKDVDAWTMVGGVPAKFIRNRPKLKYELNTKNRIHFQ